MLSDSRLPDNPGDRYGDSEDWPCGCEWTAGGMGFRPCEMHQQVPESRLWAVLEATFPDLPDVEPDPRDLDPEC